MLQKGPSANLDCLRAIAVLLVLGEHLLRRNEVLKIGWAVTTDLGFFGVLLFFVHTSLVLMQSMERSRLEGRALLKNFYTRRIFRIYPLCMFTVMVAVALRLDSGVHGGHGLSFGPWPGIGRITANLLLVQNFTLSKSIVSVLWSLPYELQMYVMLPFLYMWGRRRQIFWPLMAVWVICIYPFSLQPHIHGLSRFGLIHFIPNFLAGVIAFTLPSRLRIKSYLWPPFVLFLVVVFTLRPTALMGYALCMTLGLLIPSFADVTTPWLRAVSNRIATYSYGIYLSHQFCIWFALGFLASHSLWLRIPVLIGTLAGIPVLLYYSIEKPMIQVGVRLARNWTQPRTPIITSEVAKPEPQPLLSEVSGSGESSPA
jgi:peptidoglycan/LPS O-acetylase OafA/YrhL